MYRANTYNHRRAQPMDFAAIGAGTTAHSRTEIAALTFVSLYFLGGSGNSIETCRRYSS